MRFKLLKLTWVCFFLRWICLVKFFDVCYNFFSLEYMEFVCGKVLFKLFKKEKVVIMKFFSKGKVVNNVVSLPINNIVANPNQPRVIFLQQDLKDLAESIKINGILQPLTVRLNKENKYELVAGERRLKAAKLAGKQEVPCIVLKTSSEQSAILALMENLQRKNLNFFEEAIAISKIIDRWNITQQEVAQKLGKAQSTIANKLRILKFSSKQKQRILLANLTERHARALLKVPCGDDVDRVIDFVVEKKLNVEQTEDYIQKMFYEKKKNKPKIIPVIKDIRIFYNTINNAVKVMRKAGVQAKIQKEETGEYVKYVIKIPSAVTGRANVKSVNL